MNRIALPDSRVQVCGLPWFAEMAPRLWRFPERMQENLPEGLVAAGKQTAGVRLRLAARLELPGRGGGEAGDRAGFPGGSSGERGRPRTSARSP